MDSGQNNRQDESEKQPRSDQTGETRYLPQGFKRRREKGSGKRQITLTAQEKKKKIHRTLKQKVMAGWMVRWVKTAPAPSSWWRQIGETPANRASAKSHNNFHTKIGTESAHYD